MEGTCTAWVVWLSIATAIVVAYTFLNVASRIASASGRAAAAWLLGGAFSMGGGLWATHFITVLALALPIDPAYDLTKAVISFGISLAICALALTLGGRVTLTSAHFAVGAGIMGIGLWMMVHSGISGIRVAPPIDYEPALTVVALLMAVAASYAALWLALRFRRGESCGARLSRGVAALVLGCVIASIHYIGLAAAIIAPDAQSLPGTTLNNGWLSISLALFALGVMGATLIASAYEAYLARHVRSSMFTHDETGILRRDTLTNLPN